MTDKKLSVILTSSSAETLSRHELLQWVNSQVGGNYKKVEELCSGAAYCQILHGISPNSLSLKKVKLAAKLEHEYLHNFKQLQMAFERLGVDKSIPIERLMKGRFQDNLEFLQWYKKFSDTLAPNHSKELKPILQLRISPPRTASPTPSSAAPSTTRISRSRILTVREMPPTDIDNAARNNMAKSLSPSPERKESDADDMPSVKSCGDMPSSPSAYLVSRAINLNLEKRMHIVSAERDYYYKKLQKIDDILRFEVATGENVELVQRLLDTLYDKSSADEDETAASQLEDEVCELVNDESESSHEF